MPRDELRQPLKKRSRAERLWSKRPGALASLALLTLAAYVGGIAWLSRVPYPFAGEPIVATSIPPLEEVQTGAIDRPVGESAADPSEQATQEPEEVVTEEQALPAEPGTFQISGAQEPDIIISQNRPLKAAPLAAVTETTGDGPLPKIGAGGKKPSDLYAQITPMGVMVSDKPKIAILLGGMGLNPKLTEEAIQSLPGDISFGFAPYGNNLQAQVNKARARGHEVMLQLPLEPVGYPAINPGPNTLLADMGADDMMAALHWNMSRFAGYTGITNYMGARFLAEPASLKPVLTEVKKRGLVFLQDAAVTVSSTDDVARAAGLPVRHGEIVIDADPSPEGIAKALKLLEQQATSQGIAVGTGTGLPATIEAVANWSDELSKRGFLLVPISASFKGERS